MTDSQPKVGHQRRDWLADRYFDAMSVESDIENGLAERGLEDWTSIGGDPYDSSLEIHGVAPDERLSAELRDWLLGEAGFAKVYVNHTDGWETHYSERGERGWRRRYVSDPTAKTTNVLAGKPNPGYFEISYWPESWTHKEWLETGYMRIVPDPLEAA